MFKNITSIKVNEKGLIGLGLCVIVFFVGYYILNHISILENPPLGNTICIIIGATLTSLSILGVLLILKYMYDNKTKKEQREHKKKKNKLFHLKDRQEKKSKN